MISCRIKDIARINSRSLPEGTDPEMAFRYIDISAVDEFGRVSIPDENTTFANAPSRARRLAPPGAIVVSTVRTYLRAIATVPPTNSTLVFSTGFAALEATDKVDSRFLGYYCRSQLFVDEVVARSVGVSYPAINASDIGNIPITLPPLEEQRRIADFLDAETARIDRMVRLQEILRRRLDERERSFLDLAIENLASRFGVAPLRRFILGVEQGTSPQCDAVPAKEDEWGVLKVSCLRPLVFLEGENKRLPVGMRPNLRHEVREGDLLIARANTPELVGSTAVVPGVRKKLLLSDKIFRIRTVAGIDPRYVAIVASGSRVRALCAASSNGASQSMANIRFEEVKAWPIPPATPTYQAELVSRVESSQRLLNELRAKIDSQIRLLAERRQALITAAVNGEFDVSTASGKGVAE